MLTPYKINELVKAINTKHTKPRYGLYPPQKKIINYISRQLARIEKNNIDEVSKVKEMTDLLEGFIRYLNDTNKILKLDIEKVLTYIYYPEVEQITLDNKDNLLIGSKGETVRLWHDAYFMNNRGPIINRLIDCKNVLYDKVGSTEYTKNEGAGMPEQMHKKYEEMLAKQEKAA
ncbi:MAG: hypothetical protein H0U71_00480 [Gammaproteobacteria bacterium]|nr:hypothetical protein [Gammaproteobacteria bacterium]